MRLPKKKITLRWLNKHACSSMVDRFKEVFGKECDFTRANLIKAAETGQRPSFIAWHIPIKALNRYNDRWLEIDKQYTNTFDKGYQKAMANLIADALNLP